jgi:lipopolysaccharide transport system ATP-binding protein
VNISNFDDKKNNIIGCGFPHIDQPYLVTKEGARYLAEYSLKLPLQEGNYSLRVNISSTIVENETAEFIDVVSDAIVFRVGRWEKARVWSKVHGFSQLKLHEFEV